jgi:hypothetical protein
LLFIRTAVVHLQLFCSVERVIQCAYCEWLGLECAGGDSMGQIWYFDFENAVWVAKKTQGGLASWNFSHATKRGDTVYAVGSADGGENDRVEVETTLHLCFTCAGKVWEVMNAG